MTKIAKIGIGFGHTLTGAGSRTSVAKGYSINESQANREVGQKLVKLLSYGFDVVVANQDRPDKTKDENLRYRVKLVNDEKVDSYWEQHFNGYNGTATGTVTLRYPGTHENGQKSQRYAELMQEELVKVLGLKNRGISNRSDLHALKATNMPAIIMEPLFMDNPEDMKKYEPDKIALAEATAIYRAYGKSIDDYLPKPQKAPEKDLQAAGKPFYRVVVGSYQEKVNAQEVQSLLKQAGFNSFLVVFYPGK